MQAIDLDAAVTSPDPQPRQWTSSLSVEDEGILLTGDWLSDKLINAAQQLIQAQHLCVNGLQDVRLGQTLAFNIMQGEFIQVLHNGAGHWVVVSTIGCGPGQVDIFDSMGSYLSEALERQIAAIVFCSEDTITVRYVNN